MKKGAICDEKIHDWLFFCFISDYRMFDCRLSGQLQQSTEKEKAIELTKNEKNDSIQTRRSSAKGESVSDDAYYLKELHGYVAVYLQDGTTLYETTSLSVNNLPDEVQQDLKNGIYLKSAEELYGFLENYSS